MGLAERDYAPRLPPHESRFGVMRTWSVTTWLIAINAAVFLLDALLTPPPQLRRMFTPEMPPEDLVSSFESGGFVFLTMGPVARWCHFSAATVLDQLQLWRVATFPFVHTDIWPLMMNLACIYFFGRVLEAEFGARPFLAVYLLCGLASAAAYVALSHLGVQITGPWLPLVGASGSVLGLLIVVALAVPDDEVILWTTGISVPRRAIAWITCALLAVIILKQDSTGAGAAHFGGAVAGLLAVPPLTRRPRA